MDWTSLMKAIWEMLEQYAVENKEEDFTKMTDENRIYLFLLECLLNKHNRLIVFFENEIYDYGFVMQKLQRAFKNWSQYILTEENLDFSNIYSMVTRKTLLILI